MTREQKLVNIAGDLGLSYGKVGRAIFRLIGNPLSTEDIEANLVAHIQEVNDLLAKIRSTEPHHLHRPVPASPVLNGTQPKADVRLLADIQNAGDPARDLAVGVPVRDEDQT